MIAVLPPGMTDLLQDVGIVAAGFVALGVIWRYAIRGGWRALKALIAFCKKVASYVDRSESALELVEKELKPNGGSTLRDAVNRIDTRTAAVEEWRETAERRLAMTEMIQAQTPHLRKDNT